MSDGRLSQLTALDINSAAPTDEVEVLDKSDTSISAEGSNKRFQLAGIPRIPQPFYSQADGAGGTTTFDATNGLKQKTTLAGNRDIAITNLADGQTITLKLMQDASGSRTITFTSPTISWDGGAAPTWTTTADKSDIVVVTRDGSAYYAARAMAGI